jgi:hypothetical protein
MSTERFAHFLDSLQSWSAEAPAPAPAPPSAGGHTNANQSARVRRVKGLLEAVGADSAWRARGDILSGKRGQAGSDELDHELDHDIDSELDDALEDALEDAPDEQGDDSDQGGEPAEDDDFN